MRLLAADPRWSAHRGRPPPRGRGAACPPRYRRRPSRGACAERRASRARGPDGRTCVRFSELEGTSVGVWGAGREIGSFASQLARRLPAARIVAAAFDDLPRAPPSVRRSGPPTRASSGRRRVARGAIGLRGRGALARGLDHRPELRELRAAGVPVTTATSLWLAEHGGAGVIGSPGTKGKSTTAALACHSLVPRVAGAALAGNIGVPALDLLDDSEAPELVVLELSSYQIADLQAGPEVALITNLVRRAHRLARLRAGLPRGQAADARAPGGARRRCCTARDAAARREPTGCRSCVLFGLRRRMGRDPRRVLAEARRAARAGGRAAAAR